MDCVHLFKRILFCTDFSQEAADAFGYAVALAAAAPDAGIILFHVIPEPDAQFWKTYIYELDKIDEKAKKDIDRQFEQDYLSKAPPGLNITTRVAIGAAGEQILSAIGEVSADLVILGRRRHAGGPSFFPGDSVKTVVNKAACPVLVVPATSATR